jgi:hypothetical protein
MVPQIVVYTHMLAHFTILVQVILFMEARIYLDGLEKDKLLLIPHCFVLFLILHELP